MRRFFAYFINLGANLMLIEANDKVDLLNSFSLVKNENISTFVIPVFISIYLHLSESALVFNLSM